MGGFLGHLRPGFWRRENITSVASFGVAYLSVILIEPVVDVAVLAIAKAKRDFSSG